MCAALTVSVIIPVWNDSRRILKCIDALKKQTIPADQFEVIVVDNGSFDNTFEVISGIKGIKGRTPQRRPTLGLLRFFSIC